MEEVFWLKKRIFDSELYLEEVIIEREDTSEFALEEILEALAREASGKKAFVFSEDNGKKVSPDELDKLEIEVRESKVKADILLYELADGIYYVYARKKVNGNEEKSEYETRQNKKEEGSYGLFVPAGVIVRRVPQNVLGNGVLGRAFIYQNYIEILDSLIGNEYTEVLTHEVLHILYPEKKELDIRQMTRNYIGAQNTVYH